MTDNVIERLQTAYEDTLDFLLTIQAELQAAEQPTLPTGLPIASSSITPEPLHDASGLADASKLQYLKNCLKGAAAELVKDVTTTNANYSATWQALKARFHNPRLVVNSHLKRLMDMPYLKKESAIELRSFADEAQRIVRALTNLQMPVIHWDVWFVYLLAARLDPESQKAWETELSQRDRRIVLDNVAELENLNPLERFPKFMDLSEFLEKRVQALSMIASNAPKTEKKPSVLPRPVPGSRRVFHAGFSQHSGDGRPKCPICSGAHLLPKCYKFQAKNPFERRRESEPPAAGPETKRMAMGSLAHMYRRFARDPKLAVAYREFMTVYENLGHMERVPVSERDNPRAWYLPHHAVVQSTPLKWKIRVVFDASRKTRDGQCLNDFLLAGPALQRDLSLILLNWRRYRFVFTADVVKMFRQICVARDDQDLQRIVWAPSSSEMPVEYRLTTVTYGTACAPYLAIRTLLQLAKDERSRFPLGAQCLEFNTYVDDTFAGADELSIALRTRQELIELLKSAGVELDKWAANHSDLLPSDAQRSWAGESKSINLDESVKTLGVQWNPHQDEFRFTTSDFEGLSREVTKRAVLSNIARLFDPLGWLAPITIGAKILMQDLWILKVGWDSVLPVEVQDRWREYCNSLSALPALSISRWLGASCDSGSQIHGFSDASSRAYAAAVYIRINEADDRFRVVLLSAKSKVAPVKTVSIPNLELCGAVLLVKLLRHVRKLDFLQNLPVFTWSDSQIVLTWLRKHPCHWKTFVANRVSFIQTEMPSAKWAHVPTGENPADLATRGCRPADLIEARLWWHGPDWLAMHEEHWPKAALAPHVLLVKATPSDPEILAKFSSLTRLIRVVAYCLRPLVGLRRRKSNLPVLPEFLTASELSGARISLVKLAQMGKSLPKRNPLLSLDPFLDKTDGVLRVGGRLVNSVLSHDRKHPPILPRHSPLSRLFVRYAHRACLHGGPTLTLSTLMQHAWILGRNRLVKTEIRYCVVCQQVKPRFAWQMMGSLPATRAADKELRAMFSAASTFYKCAAATLANDGTSWKFIPPNSPHYGGLWEAGVKSVKHHLKRVIGNRPLTFEEFATVLVEIEACLNSRPLCPLSNDVEDLRVLTPAHFLGVATGLIPEDAPPDVCENRLERFQILQLIRNNFWKRWSQEYLQHLQERAKWRGPAENFAVGQLVLVRDDRYPPSKWPLGRVTEVHVGPDGLVRVVTVRTATSTLRRHVARLCTLLLEQNPPNPGADGTTV
ncbi:uncharacterized protein LOC143308232 [Osmia lignaria lignaria]|uniref:uncharacterized protein LOC143308232 n=1 Tax=Osmia lignaria lignaria TaxID=1437193 RepID=UPI00402B6B55